MIVVECSSWRKLKRRVTYCGRELPSLIGNARRIYLVAKRACNCLR